MENLPQNPAPGALPPNQSPWDSLAYPGERNINDGTGEERTFTESDRYPKQPGETNEEYEDRLRRMRRAVDSYLQNERAITDDDGQRTEHYAHSDQGQQELQAEARLDALQHRLDQGYQRLEQRLDQAVAQGKFTREHADSLLARQKKKNAELLIKQADDTIAEIDDIRQDWEDRQSIGTPEERARYDEWLLSHDEENQRNLERTGRGEDEPVDDGNNEGGEDEPVDDGHEAPQIGEIEVGIEEIRPEEINNERMQQLERQLSDMLPGLAELYAKSRRLIDFHGDRARFVEVREQYGQMLDELLRLRASETYSRGQREYAEGLEAKIEQHKADIEQQLLEFVGGNLETTEKTQDEIDTEKARLVEEANAALQRDYGEAMEQIRTNVNAEFLQGLIAQETTLEQATIDRLDNGSMCRRIVSRVIANPYAKGILLGATIAGLAVTGVGLATGLAAGTMTIGLGYTAAGVATGAVKGATIGTLASRQDSRNSAVRGFATETQLRAQLEGIDPLVAGEDASNVASWLLGQYGKAEVIDESSNRRRSLISAGIGGLLGGLASGVQINNIERTTKTWREQTGTTPVEVGYEVDLSRVDIPEGHGMYDTFTQLGGDPANAQQAYDIAHSFDSAYGLSPGSNGVVPGYDGTVGEFAHTYPGRISTWPETVQAYTREVAEEWARQGLIPARVIKTGGEPIYSTFTKVVENYIPNAFLNFLTRASADGATGVIGGGIGGLRNGRPSVEAPTRRPAAEQPVEEPSEPDDPATQNEPNQVPSQPTEADDGRPTAQTEAQPAEQPFPTLVQEGMPEGRVYVPGIGTVGPNQEPQPTEEEQQPGQQGEPNPAQTEAEQSNDTPTVQGESEPAQQPETPLSQQSDEAINAGARQFEIAQAIANEIPGINDEGFRILIDNEPSSPEARARVRQWYDSQDDQDTLSAFRNYLNNHPDRAPAAQVEIMGRVA